MRKILFFCFIISTILNPCYADVDWKILVVRVFTGDQSAATRLLKQELSGIQYNAHMSVGDFFDMHPELELPIYEYLKRPKIDQHYLTDGTIEYGYHLPLVGGIIQEILPDAQPVSLMVPMLCPTCRQPWPEHIHLPEGVSLIPKNNEASDFSGIIIDCRGLALEPCLFPRILSEGMVDVYSSDFADPQYLIMRGLATYHRDEKQTQIRTGENPLRIKAMGITGDCKTNIIISTSDAQTIHSAQNNLNLLRECRVAIIVGE
jgi:hypothetical protein